MQAWLIGSGQGRNKVIITVTKTKTGLRQLQQETTLCPHLSLPLQKKPSIRGQDMNVAEVVGGGGVLFCSIQNGSNSSSKIDEKIT